MNKIVLESMYLLPISALCLVNSADLVLIDQYEFYQKKSYRNRAHICNSNGLFRLTIPLEAGKNQQTPMKDVRIANTDAWQKHHWQSIVSAYNRSPYFEYYQDELKQFYNKKYEFLLDFNMEILSWFIKVFKINTTIQLSTTYVENEQLNDYRNTIHPNPNKQTYKAELNPYQQVFSDRLAFQQDLSAIDLLLNAGPYVR